MKPPAVAASNKNLTDKPPLDEIGRNSPTAKTRKTLIRRYLAVRSGFGRDPECWVRIPLGLPRKVLRSNGFRRTGVVFQVTFSQISHGGSGRLPETAVLEVASEIRTAA